MKTKPCLSMDDAKKIAAGCEREAFAKKWAVTIAIVDDGGFLLHLDRMDGAAVTTAEVATGKARTSALTRRPSKDFEERVKERPSFISFPAGLFIQGAVPIMHDNECVGAIGVSGGVLLADDDELVKRKKIRRKLRATAAVLSLKNTVRARLGN